MDRANRPTITKGPHTREGIALDHALPRAVLPRAVLPRAVLPRAVLPRAVVPELAARFYNLEAIPAKANLAKSAKIGQRELDPVRRWQKSGLLSAAGLAAVEAATKNDDSKVARD